MLSLLLSLIIMINPIGLFLYLTPVSRQLPHKDFVRVLLKASCISLCVYLVFLILGDFIFEQVFKVQFDSFRIFGGIVIFSMSYMYIVRGRKALLKIKEDLDDLAAEIALPFMVGAGSISITMLIGNSMNLLMGALTVISAVTASFVIILVLKYLRDLIKNPKNQIAFDKNMSILLRLNGFFVGAVGVNMVATGIRNLFLK